MNRPLVFNHHALPYPTQEQAKTDLPDFIRTTFQCCRRYAFQLILLDGTLDPAWHNIQLAPDYYWRDWLAKDSRSDRESRQAFLSLATQSPLIKDGVGWEYEVGLPGQQTSLAALQAAVVHQTYLLSLPSVRPWNEDWIKVWINTLRQDDLVCDERDLPNVCGHVSLALHASDLARLKLQCVTSGQALWDSRMDLFPYLIFLSEPVGSQLCKGDYRADVWKKTRHALDALNRFAEVWQADRQIVYRAEELPARYNMPCKVSGESPSTLHDSKKRAKREFWLPTGKKVCFSDHVKLPQSFRLHFYPDAEARKLYIGYLGPHLPV